MAKLFLSMSGEGRGHAARVYALTEQLRLRHDLTVFAPPAAYRMLSALAKRHGFALHAIPGITNTYRADQSLDTLGTAVDLRHYVLQLPHLVESLSQHIRAEKPDLIVTDFEPALPRAARRCGVPWMSVDHQHWLVVGDVSDLPATLRWHAGWIGAVVRGICPLAPAIVVSSFFRVPLKPGFRNVEQVGALLRTSMLALQPSQGDHVLAYFRRRVPAHVIDALAGCGNPVRVYGMSGGPGRRNLTFHALDADQFAAELASCRALVTTAGNQLIGEAMYLGKPVLAMAEAGNAEQSLNAHFVARSGGGIALDMERCDATNLREFLGGLDRLRPPAIARDGQGTKLAVAAIERMLQSGGQHAASARLDVA